MNVFDVMTKEQQAAVSKTQQALAAFNKALRDLAVAGVEVDLDVVSDEAFGSACTRQVNALIRLPGIAI